MSGTKVTSEDLATGEHESKVIEDDWMLVTDGDVYLHGVQRYANGTTVLTVKRDRLTA